MDDYRYHAKDTDTERACRWIEDFISIGSGRNASKAGINWMFRAFDALMRIDFEQYPDRS